MRDPEDWGRRLARLPRTKDERRRQSDSDDERKHRERDGERNYGP